MSSPLVPLHVGMRGTRAGRARVLRVRKSWRRSGCAETSELLARWSETYWGLHTSWWFHQRSWLSGLFQCVCGCVCVLAGVLVMETVNGLQAQRNRCSIQRAGTFFGSLFFMTLRSLSLHSSSNYFQGINVRYKLVTATKSKCRVFSSSRRIQKGKHVMKRGGGYFFPPLLSCFSENIHNKIFIRELIRSTLKIEFNYLNGIIRERGKNRE